MIILSMLNHVFYVNVYFLSAVHLRGVQPWWDQSVLRDSTMLCWGKTKSFEWGLNETFIHIRFLQLIAVLTRYSLRCYVLECRWLLMLTRSILRMAFWKLINTKTAEFIDLVQCVYLLCHCLKHRRQWFIAHVLSLVSVNNIRRHKITCFYHLYCHLPPSKVHITQMWFIDKQEGPDWQQSWSEVNAMFDYLL